MQKPSWRPGWYRSLYWRAAFSFVTLVTGVVAAQAALSYWLVSRDAAARVSRLDLTLSAAEKLGSALARTPALDLSAYLNDTDSTGRLFVIMRDGRIAGATLDRYYQDGHRGVARSELDRHPRVLAT
jgi:hypothetical protein